MSEVFEKKSISSDLAHRVIAAAEAKATEMGVPMGIAICDEAGVLKAFSRMDGAALFAVQIAQDKAYTAVGFGMPSGGGTTSSRTIRHSPRGPSAGSIGL